MNVPVASITLRIAVLASAAAVSAQRVAPTEPPVAPQAKTLEGPLAPPLEALQRGAAPTRESTGRKGPFKVAKLRERDGMRDGPDYRGATIYYPTDAEPPLAGIVIVPGFGAPERSVAAWGPFFASHGIVAMTIGTNRREDVVGQRCTALLDAVRSLRAERDRKASPLFGKLDPRRIGVAGWSMGGGGAQLAARKDPWRVTGEGRDRDAGREGSLGLKCVLALCPWNPTRSRQAFVHPVPLLVLGGERDAVAAVARHAVVHYERTPASTPKAYFEVKRQGHFAANSPRVADGDVGRVALAWLKVFLEGDLRYRSMLLETPKTASRYETNLARRLPEAMPPFVHSGPIVRLIGRDARGWWSASRAGLRSGDGSVWRPHETGERIFDFAVGAQRWIAVGGRPARKGAIWCGSVGAGGGLADADVDAATCGSDVAYAVGIDPLGSQAVVGCADGRVLAYPVPALTEPAVLVPHTAACRAVAFFQGRLATVGYDGNLHVYRSLSTAPRVVAAHSAGIESVLWVDGGEAILTGAKDGSVCLHTAEAGRLVRTYHRLGAAVLCLGRDPLSGGWLAGLANGRVLKLAADEASAAVVHDAGEPIHALAIDSGRIMLGLAGRVLAIPRR